VKTPKKSVKVRALRKADQIGELFNLNQKYGGKVGILNKRQSFICADCGYREDFTPHGKIKMGEYSVRDRPVIGVDASGSPIYSYIAHFIFFSFKCNCSVGYKIQSGPTFEYILKLLREERDFVEKNKKRPYETMIV